MKQSNGFSILLILIFCAGWTSSFSQNKILLISGKEIDAASYMVGDQFITYKTVTKKKSGEVRTSTKALERFDVFSVTQADGTEEIIYTPDSVDFTIDEARTYIKGEQAASQFYHRPANGISSAVIGVGSSILSFYALPVPMVYAVVLGRFNTRKIKVPDTYDQEMINKDAFRLGYQKTARNLKIQQSLKWGYIGLGVGLTALIIYGASNK